jgi:multidrug efflux pump subunit AcrB/acyl-coenzyme A thioesterase PaaI-like protein
MGGMTKFSLKNTVAVVILCVLVLVAGLFSTNRIGVETFPDVTFPAVFVQTIYPGASTEEMETEVTIPVETELLALQGYDSITSTTAEFSSAIFLLYPFGTDMDKVVADVEAAVEKANVPQKADTIVARISPNTIPIFEAAVTLDSSADAAALQQVMETKVVPALEQVEGVSSVDLQGGNASEIRIQLKDELVRAQGITSTALRDAIQSRNFAFPLGSVDEAGVSVPVRFVGELEGIEALKDARLSVRSFDGTSRNIRLIDVADVNVETAQKVIARYNGQPAFLISVNKEQEANTAEVAESVRSTLSGFNKLDGFSYAVISDLGQEVEKSVETLLKEGGYGTLFTVIVIFLFLRNIRATIIAILSLPLSILLTISVLDLTGNTLNIMTLGGLAVAIGRIVDDSIVIIENIYRWRQVHGPKMPGHKLAFLATREVLGPVASSTVATVVVFLPLAFVSGIIGEFFTPFAIAVVASITASLIVSLTLIPVLGSAFFTRVREHRKTSWLVRVYEPLLRGSLRRKGLVFALSVVLLAGSLGLVKLLGLSFLPAGGDVFVRMKVNLPAEARLAQTDRVARDIEAYLQQQDEVERMYLRIGIRDNTDAGLAPPTDDTASFILILRKGVDVTAFNTRLTKEVTTLVTTQVPQAKVSVAEIQQQGPPSGNNIDVTLYSDDPAALSEAARIVENFMVGNDGLKNIRNSLNEVQDKWVVRLNANGEQLGVDPMLVGMVVSERLRPAEIADFKWGDRDWNVTVAYENNIEDMQALKRIPIVTPTGPRTLGDIAVVEQTSAPITIQHEGGRMNAVVSGDIISTDTAAVSAAVEQDILALQVPEGVEVNIGGGFEMIFEGFEDLGLAMIAAVGLVFLVLSVTFGGILTPMIIMTSLAFVPIGAFTGLLITGQTLSMSAMIGLLMLIGIVVTNAVVLLQRIEQNRRDRMALHDSIIEASITRLRPILMTAFATIFALLPLAVSESTSGLISKGLAVTVIGGLTTSTLLTLLFVPTLYAAVGRWRRLDLNPIGLDPIDSSTSAAGMGEMIVGTQTKPSVTAVSDADNQLSRTRSRSNDPIAMRQANTEMEGWDTLERIKQQPMGGFSETMGFVSNHMSGHQSVVTLETNHSHYDESGHVHSAVLTALLQHAMKQCANDPGLRPELSFTNLNVQFVETIHGGKLTATASIVHKSGATLSIHATLTDEQGQVGAVASGNLHLRDEQN